MVKEFQLTFIQINHKFPLQILLQKGDCPLLSQDKTSFWVSSHCYMFHFLVSETKISHDLLDFMSRAFVREVFIDYSHYRFYSVYKLIAICQILENLFDSFKFLILDFLIRDESLNELRLLSGFVYEHIDSILCHTILLRYLFDHLMLDKNLVRDRALLLQSQIGSPLSYFFKHLSCFAFRKSRLDLWF